MFSMRSSISFLFSTILILILTGCGTKPVMNLGGPFHIETVEMMGPGTSMQLQDLGHKVKADTRLVPQTQNPKNLRLTILNYHKKNGGMSLLVGDRNSLNVLVEVVEPTTGDVVSRFNSAVSSDAMINGVIGAIAAAASSDEKVQASLNTLAARDIMEHLYGSKMWHQFERRR
jgi:hypothetical protein